MYGTPVKMTIMPDFGGGFSVIAQTIDGKIEIANGLAFDEMLGVTARSFCPTFSDGEPIRSIGQPLFLEKPSQSKGAQ